MNLTRNTFGTERIWRRRAGVLSYACIVFLLSFSPAARVVPYLVPAGALWLGVQTFRKDKEVFTEFLCWLYFLTPFIRRVVDYKTQKPEVLILTAPLLMLLAPLLSLVSINPRVANRKTAPFLYAIAAVLYGTLIAAATFHVVEPAAVLPAWLLPIFWGLYIFVERRDLPAIRRGFERAMMAGTLVAGVYGVLQYYLLPKWDSAWMISAEMVTFGRPEPLEVRVFSIMNAPQILAVFLMAGMLLAYVSKSRWKYYVLAAGFASLILSSARSSWIGFVGAVLYLAFRGSFRERLRVLSISVGCAIMLVGLTQIPSLSAAVTTRLSSLIDPQNDLSAQDRTESNKVVADLLTGRPVGYGLGVDAGFNDAEHDSSLVNIGFNLGFPGGFVFLLDLAILSFVLLFLNSKKDGTSVLGLQACLFGVLIELPANNVVAGPTGFVLWSVIGLVYATRTIQSETSAAVAPMLSTSAPEDQAVPAGSLS